MIAFALMTAGCICAFMPACLFVINYCIFREPKNASADRLPNVDVLIPARNEAENIRDVLRSVLASTGISLEVWVYDDHSTDGTVAIVESVAEQDSRVHLLRGGTLPEGWNGKQHACWQLAQAGTAPLMLFLDADVRLEPGAILRCVRQQQRSKVALLSGFPRIVTVTWMEWLLLPMIQFVLLSLLPMFRMRSTTKPAYAAGCGQFMLAEREPYFACGGHGAIRATRHDGLRLPYLFRKHGSRSDVCDLTNLAHVRMYRSAAGVWDGLAKNATEGLGSPGRIVPLSVLLFVGQILPSVLVLYTVVKLWPVLPLLLHGAYVLNVSQPFLLISFVSAFLASYLVRLIMSVRFKQPLRSVLFHPVGVLFLLALQWYALVRQLIGKPVGWRARSYSSTTGEQVN